MEKNGNRKLMERKGKNGVKARTGICLLLTVCVCLVGFPTETGKPVGKETAGWTRAAEAEGAEAVEMEEWPAVANEDGTGENTPEDVSGSGGEQGENGEGSGSGEGQGSSGEGSGSGGEQGSGSSGEGSGSGEGQGSSGEGSGSGGEQGSGSSGEGSGSGEGQGSSGEGSGSGEGQGSSGEGSGSGEGQGSSGEGSGSGEGQGSSGEGSGSGGEQGSGSSGEGSGSGEGQGSSGEGSGSGEGQGSSGEGSGSGEGQSGTGEGSGSGEGQGSSGEGSGSGTGEGQGDPEPSADPTETVEVTPTPTPSPEPEETEDPSVFVMEGDVLIRYTGKQTKVMIPDGVRVIGPGAFDRNKTIEEVVLPDSVEEIREGAFADCSNLKKIKRTENSRLSVLEARAFAYCTKLDKSFAEGIVEQAENTFEGVPDATPTPTPMPDAPQDPSPTPSPTSTPTPAATPEAVSDEEDGFYDDIEWEIPSTSTRTTSSGQRKPRHTRNRTKFTHDYDQVVIGAGETEPMQELTLGGEVLELSLKGMNGGPAAFTAAFAVGGKIWDGSAEDAQLVDTLVLKATSETGNRWTMNGNVLRQLYKTGIDYLVLRDARADVILPTEGFLAGRVYDEMKSRGVGGRKFDYTLETGDSLKWAVAVEGEAFGLDENPAAPIYLTGVTIVSKNPGSGSSARMDSGDGSRE